MFSWSYMCAPGRVVELLLNSLCVELSAEFRTSVGNHLKMKTNKTSQMCAEIDAVIKKMEGLDWTMMCHNTRGYCLLGEVIVTGIMFS